MRYRLKDILGTITLASLYLGAGSALCTVADATIVLGIIVLFFLFDGVLLFHVGSNLLSSLLGKSRRRITSIRSPWPWRSHMLMAAVAFAAVLVAWLTWGKAGSPLAFFALLAGATAHIYLLANGSVTFYGNGVVVRGLRHSWSRSRFDVTSDGEDNWLQVDAPWYRWNQRVHLPTDRVEEAREIIAARQ